MGQLDLYLSNNHDKRRKLYKKPLGTYRTYLYSFASYVKNFAYL